VVVRGGSAPLEGGLLWVYCYKGKLKDFVVSSGKGQRWRGLARVREGRCVLLLEAVSFVVRSGGKAAASAVSLFSLSRGHPLPIAVQISTNVKYNRPIEAIRRGQTHNLIKYNLYSLTSYNLYFRADHSNSFGPSFSSIIL